MSISYHTQFRENQRKKISNDLLSTSKATTGGQLPAQRSTAVVKQPIRSDTFTLPTKRRETNSKVPQVDQIQNDLRLQRLNRPLITKKLPPAAEDQHTETMKKTRTQNRTTVRQRNPILNQQNGQRRPVRFTNVYDEIDYSASPTLPPHAPAYYPKSAPLADPLPRETLDNTRRMYNPNDDYVIQHRKPSPAYKYAEHRAVSELPPITQSTNPTAPTVIIYPKESSSRSDPPTVVIHSKEHPIRSDPPQVFVHSQENSYPTVLPNYYSSSAPFMFLPNSNAPTSTMFLPNSTAPTSMMFLPNSTIPSYSSTSPMNLPTTTTVPTQAPLQTFFLQPPPPSTFLSPPLFYPFPLANPKPNMPPPLPPPPVPQTIINQSSSSSSSAVPATVHTENKIETSNATISKKNITIQLDMLDEDNPRVVRVVREPVHHDYLDYEPERIVYERPRQRTAFVRRPEYVYVDDPPLIHRRHRSEFVYLDNDHPLEYEEEYVYADNYGNEVEYIYDDQPRYYRKPHRPSVANIVYE